VQQERGGGAKGEKTGKEKVVTPVLIYDRTRSPEGEDLSKLINKLSAWAHDISLNEIKIEVEYGGQREKQEGFKSVRP